MTFMGTIGPSNTHAAVIDKSLSHIFHIHTHPVPILSSSMPTLLRRPPACSPSPASALSLLQKFCRSSSPLSRKDSSALLVLRSSESKSSAARRGVRTVCRNHIGLYRERLIISNGNMPTPTHRGRRFPPFDDVRLRTLCSIACVQFLLNALELFGQFSTRSLNVSRSRRSDNACC
jgi:hypothetical protein